ncbi:DUF6069 family protein [Brevibacterium sediminis]|uniref:DUF6069 family protein n=1 Tax=Brevibacterium sediminis TaxID=1857024 RepID=UPI003B3AD9D4
MSHSTNHGPAPVPAPAPKTTPAQPSKHRSTAESQTTPLHNASAVVAIVTLAAAFAALAVWAIAVPVAGATLIAGGLTVSPAAVALVSLGSGCAGGISYSIMKQFRGGTVMWTVFACSVLAMSMAGPLMSGANGATVAVLELMHLAVGATTILGLRILVPRSANRASDNGSDSSGSGPSTAPSE